MQPNTKPVIFDFTSAETFVSALKKCKEKIENQIPERNKVTEYAKTELKGKYAQIFSDNADNSTVLAQEIINALENAAKNMQEYIQAAHEEVRIRAEIEDWEGREDARRKLRANKTLKVKNEEYYVPPKYRDINPDDPTPPKPKETTPPHYEPYISTSASKAYQKFQEKSQYTGGVTPTALGYTQWGNNLNHAPSIYADYSYNPKVISGNFTQDKVSGIPANLFTYCEKIKNMGPVIENEQSVLKNTYNTFKQGTKWGEFDADALIEAVYMWVQDTYLEAVRAGKVGEALWKAGSQGDLNEANPNLSNPYRVHTADGSVVFSNVEDIPLKGSLPFVPSATITGGVPSSGYSNDPVSVATGNFIEPELDLAFDNTAARTLKLRRMYNSVAVVHKSELPSGIFGPGWSSTLDTKLVFTSDEAQWYTDDGRILSFTREGDGYSRAPGEPWWLTKTTPGDSLYDRANSMCVQAHEQTGAEFTSYTNPHYWAITNNEHTTHTFAADGTWVSTTVGHPSNTVVAVRKNYSAQESRPESTATQNSPITDLVHPTTGRAIHIDYAHHDGETARPSQAYTYNTVGGHAGMPLTIAEYGYTPTGHLTTVSTATGTRTYTHTPEGLIHEVSDVNGHVEVTNTYDNDGRVVHQVSEYDYDISYQYAPGGITIISGENAGVAPNIFYSDEKGRLIGVTASDGSHYTMRYNSLNNRVSETQRDGSTVTRSFDERGRLVRERTPEGADYTYSWDEYDRVTAVSVLDARDTINLGTPITISYGYTDESNPNPSMLTDGTGATTYYEWDGNGNLTSSTDPTGVTTTFGYDIHGDLISVTDGAGNVIHLVRDEQGRVTQTINPLGETCTLRYNASGVPISYEDAAGSRWTFTYPQVTDTRCVPAIVREKQQLQNRQTSGGLTHGVLPSAVTDPYGNTTTFTYNRANDIVSITDPLGRVLENVYDVRGNLAKVINEAGSTWSYTYDGLSQLTTVTDPAGGITRYTYDMNSKITSVTDPTGVEVKYSVNRKHGIEETVDAFGSSFRQVDVLGRVVSEGSTRKPIAHGSGHGIKAQLKSVMTEETGVVTYDAAGRPVEVLDAAGGLTCYERDGAGRVLRVISAAGRIEAYEYDAAGRVISHAVGLDAPGRYTDEAGVSRVVEPSVWAITRLEYDAASQIIRRVNPNGSVEKITYDVCGRVIGVESGARVASYEYDLCGRLVGVRDSSFGQRRFKYDAAGQMVQATDGLGFRTHFSYTATGQVCRVVDATGQVTDYEYDAMDRLVRVIKAAGTVDESVQEYAYDAAGRLIRAHDGVREYTHTYDYAAGGRLSHTCVDGVKAAEFGVQDQGRTVWVRDYASVQALDGNASGDAFVQHRFVYDARGLLVERSRSGVMTDTSGESSGAADVDAQVQALNTFTNTGAYTLTLGYDADGYRTRMVTPYGETAVIYDGAGRMVRVSDAGASAGVGAELSYDVLGRLTRVQVADVVSSWEFDDISGLACSYTQEELVGDASGYGRQSQVLAQTNVIRDEQGRVVGLDSADGLVVYTYDAAGQLTGSRAGDLEFEWVFEAGLMQTERTWRRTDAGEYDGMGERVLLSERSFAYNRLNQLTETVLVEYAAAIAPEFVGLQDEVMNRTITSYEYNAAGERILERVASNLGVRSVREYTWGVFGGLASVTDTVSTDAFHRNFYGVTGSASRVRLVSDVTGELAQVTGAEGASVPLVWDPNPVADIPSVIGAGGMPAPGSDGGFSQVGTAGGMNPWGTPEAAMLPSVLAEFSSHAGAGLPAGFVFNGAGSVSAAGLEVMGARVADPASRRFLSTDPLPAVTGTGFFADTYAFCGNNPVGLIDPWGTQEVSNELANDTSIKGWVSRNARELKEIFFILGIAIAVGAAPFTGGLSLYSAAVGMLAGGSAGAFLAMSNTIGTRMDKKGYVDLGNLSDEGFRGMLQGMALGAGETLIFGYGGKYTYEGYTYFKNTRMGQYAISTGNSLKTTATQSRIYQAATQTVSAGWQGAKQMAQREISQIPKMVRAIPEYPVVQYARSAAYAGGARAKGAVEAGWNGAKQMAGREVSQVSNMVRAIPEYPVVQYARSAAYAGGARAKGAVEAGWNTTKEMAKSSWEAGKAAGQRYTPVVWNGTKNAGVNFATGAGTNAVFYGGEYGLKRALGSQEDFNWGELGMYMGSGATGNVLGGSVKPMVGSGIQRFNNRSVKGNGGTPRFTINPEGKLRTGLEASGAGALNLANAEAWNLATGKGDLSNGDKAYALLAGGLGSQVGGFKTPLRGADGKRLSFEDTKLGAPLKAPSYMDSYRAMAAGHPGRRTSASEWNRVVGYGTANAGVMALTDLAKSYVVNPLVEYAVNPAMDYVKDNAPHMGEVRRWPQPMKDMYRLWEQYWPWGDYVPSPSSAQNADLVSGAGPVQSQQQESEIIKPSNPQEEAVANQAPVQHPNGGVS